MPIRHYLSGRVFDPETIQVMSDAFTSVCACLGLVERDDPATRMVAERIITHAERGVTRRSDIYALVISQFHQGVKYRSRRVSSGQPRSA
jgi:hypothetical protein